MSDEILWPDTPFNLTNHTHIIARRGSEAHGLFVPSTDPNSIDDRDLMVAVIPPADYYLGLKTWQHTESIKGCWDVVAYEWKKLVNLLIKQNPNVISILWLENEDYLRRSIIGDDLIYHREFFKHHQAAYDSFLGYSLSQLKKMTSGAFKGYMGDKRKKLVEKHGHDSKCAGHLIRLLHMGAEYLETGTLNVKRTWDRDMLLEIKQGKWKLDQVQKYAQDRIQYFEGFKNESALPKSINFEYINEMTNKQIERALNVYRLRQYQ